MKNIIPCGSLLMGFSYLELDLWDETGEHNEKIKYLTKKKKIKKVNTNTSLLPEYIEIREKTFLIKYATMRSHKII